MIFGCCVDCGSESCCVVQRENIIRFGNSEVGNCSMGFGISWAFL